MINNIFKTTILMLLAAAFFGFYLSVSTALPYYFAWDMDLITALDVLVIRSGYLPDHMAHPGQGMLLMLNPFVTIGHWLGLVSTTNINELSDSLVPLLGIAELTDWLRLASPILVFGLVMVLFITVESLFSRSIFFSILIFLFFATSIFTVVHSTTLRTEQFAGFFWSISLLFCVLASRTAHLLRFKSYVCAVGFFIGLAFFTKIQVMILLAVSVLFLLYLLNSRSEMRHNFIDTSSLFYRRLVTFNFYTFTTLSALSYLIRVGPTILTFRDRFGPTPWWLAAFSVLTTLYFTRNKLSQRSESVRMLAGVLSLVIFGLILSLSTHFLMPNEILINFRHLLLTFKITFLGSIDPNQMTSVNNMRGLPNYLNQAPLFVFFFAAVALRILTLRPLKNNFVQVILVYAIAIFLLANTWLTIRSMTGLDILWVEISIGFFAVCFLLMGLNDLPKRHEQKAKTAAIFILGFLILRGFSNQIVMAENVSTGHFRETKFYKNIYGGNQLRIKPIIDEKLNPQVDRQALSLVARNYKRQSHEWREQVLNLSAISKNMSYLQLGLATTRMRPHCKVAEINGLPAHTSTLDVSQLADQTTSSWRNWISIFAFSPHVRKSFPSGQIALYPRPDRKLYIFFERDEFVSNVAGQNWDITREPIARVTEICPLPLEEKVDYVAYELFGAAGLDNSITYLEPERIKGSYFLAQLPSPAE